MTPLRLAPTAFTWWPDMRIFAQVTSQTTIVALDELVRRVRRATYVAFGGP